MHKMSSLGGGKVHLASLSKNVRGAGVLYCTGRTMSSLVLLASGDAVTCGSCQKKAAKEGVELHA